MIRIRTWAAFVLGLILCGTSAVAQEKPAVKLEVDLRDAAKRIYHAKMEFPVTAGPLTLVYPKWIPGEHAPNGPIVDVTGLHFRADGKEIVWRRDLVDLYAFHCDIPAGVTKLEATLDYLLPTEEGTAERASGNTGRMELPMYPRWWG